MVWRECFIGVLDRGHARLYGVVAPKELTQGLEMVQSLYHFSPRNSRLWSLESRLWLAVKVTLGKLVICPIFVANLFVYGFRCLFSPMDNAASGMGFRVPPPHNPFFSLFLFSLSFSLRFLFEFSLSFLFFPFRLNCLNDNMFEEQA